MGTTKNDFDLRSLLDYINPDIEHDTWVQVGMALKYEGYPVEVWEEWSRRGSKFHERECASVWNSFRMNTDKPVTGGTIVYLAQEGGWKSPDGKVYSWDDILTDEDIARATAAAKAPTEPERQQQQVRKATPKREAAVSESRPRDKKIPVKIRPEHRLTEPASGWNATKDALTYLRVLYRPEDHLNVNLAAAWDEGKKKWHPAGNGVNLTAGELVRKLQQEADRGVNAFDPAMIGAGYTPAAGAWLCINPTNGKGRGAGTVTDYRYTLIEADEMPIEAQRERLEALNLPIAAIVSSGGKSLHAVVKIGAKDAEEYTARVRSLYEYCKEQGFKIDEACKNANRLTRLPGVMRGGRPQFLVTTSCGAADFDAWSLWRTVQRLPGTVDTGDVYENPPSLAPDLIEGVLRQGGKMILTGPSKSRKTWALIQLAAALVTGGKWMESFPCRKSTVLYINMEVDRASFINRINKVTDALQVPRASLSGRLVSWTLRGVRLTQEQYFEYFDELIRELRPGAVIIDPIYKVMLGDENKADVVAALCCCFDRLTEEGCSVIYAHHTKKGGGAGYDAIDRGSGSGVFGRDADAAIDFCECVEEGGSDPEHPLYKASIVLRDYPPYQEPLGVRFFFPLHRRDDEALANAAEKSTRTGGQIKGRNTQQNKAEKRRGEIRATIENRAKDGKKTNTGYLADLFEVDRKTINRDIQTINETWEGAHYAVDKSGNIST